MPLLTTPPEKIADVEDSDGAEAAADKDAFVGDTAGKAKIAENVDGGKLRADDTDGAVDDPAGETRHAINQDTGPKRRSQRGNRTTIGNATGKLVNVEYVNTAGEPSDNPSLVDNAAKTLESPVTSMPEKFALMTPPTLLTMPPKKLAVLSIRMPL